MDKILKIAGILFAIVVVVALAVTLFTWRRQSATNEAMAADIAELKKTERQTLELAADAIRLLDSLHYQNKAMAVELAASSMRQETIYSSWKATNDSQRRKIEQIREALTAKNADLRARSNKYTKAK